MVHRGTDGRRGRKVFQVRGSEETKERGPVEFGQAELVNIIWVW